MSTKTLFSYLLLFFGEAIIITAFILFRGETTTDVLTLNIVVSSIIYGLFFVDIIVPWVDFENKPQKRVGSLGLRWFVTWMYAILAITVMIVGNSVYHFSFSTQIIIHLALLFFVLLGLFGASQTSKVVGDVHQVETANRNGILEMKQAIGSLKDKINLSPNIPQSFIDKIHILEENVRYLSSINNKNALELEQSFIETIHEIGFALSDYSLNEERIESNLKKCERIFQSRKQMYSN